MSKRELRLFAVALILTLMLFAWVAAFISVDTNTSRFEYRDATPALYISKVSEEDPFRYRVYLFGNEIPVTLEKLNEFEAWRQQHAGFVTPPKLLGWERLRAAGFYLYQEGKAWYGEYNYQKQVAANQTEVPQE